jgi:hypothetical protein
VKGKIHLGPAQQLSRGCDLVASDFLLFRRCALGPRAVRVGQACLLRAEVTSMLALTPSVLAIGEMLVTKPEPYADP